MAFFGLRNALFGFPGFRVLYGAGGGKIILSGQVRPRQGTEICNFGATSPLEALHWIFCFSSSIYVQLVRRAP